MCDWPTPVIGTRTRGLHRSGPATSPRERLSTTTAVISRRAFHTPTHGPRRMQVPLVRVVPERTRPSAAFTVSLRRRPTRHGSPDRRGLTRAVRARARAAPGIALRRVPGSEWGRKGVRVSGSPVRWSRSMGGVEAVMGLPDPNAAGAWGGRLLVDRDGAEIGRCTQIFVDDTTGKPEWATADMGGRSAVIPLLDAVESGLQVRVAVRRVEVADAPSLGDVQHLSEDEEERLYRHYGIAYSREASDSVLPADQTPAPAPPVSSNASVAPASATSVERPGQEMASGQTGADLPEAADALASTSSRWKGQRLLVLITGLVAALGVIVGVVLRLRRRRQRSPTRTERLAARARSASHALDAGRRQVAASAAPLVQSSRQVSVAAAQRAARQAAAAAEQASAMAALARSMRLPRTGGVTGPEGTATSEGAEKPTRLAAALKMAVSFGAGYLLGSSAGRARLEQAKQSAARWAQRPEMQQTRSRLRAGATDAWQAGNARLTQRAARMSGRFAHRSGNDVASLHGSPADNARETASENGHSADSPENR
jgi:hypothetical protein